MKRFLARASVAGLSAALVAGVALVAAPAASAAQIGTLSSTNLTGQGVAFTVQTSGPCTDPLATNFYVTLTNDTSVPGNTANLPATPAGFLMGNTAGSTIAGGINSGPFTATIPQTLQTYAGNNGLPQLGAGTYLMQLICRQNLQTASLGEFKSQLVIGAGGAVTSLSPVLQSVNTSTVVSASPASIDTLGSATFTATVTPASGTAIAGQVQFKVNGANFGSPVAVNASGVAVSGAYSSATTGNKTVTADFLGGADSLKSYGTSTGSTTLAVTQASATTTTGISLSSASVAYPATVTATATVTRGAGVPVTGGTVQFKVDGVNVGAPVAVASGSAVSPSFGPATAGSKTVTAEFVGGENATSQFGNSSDTDTLSVSQATASTTTNIALSSASVAYPATVTATATVTGPVTIDQGTVQFKVDGVNVGSPVAVDASGVAVSAPISRNAGGPYAVTAVYSGATVAGVEYGGSTSPSASFEVTAAQYAPDVQNIKTTIPAGTLVISTPYSCATVACDAPGDNPLDLGNMVLNATATEYKSFGTFTGIQVTDTRPGNLPWTVSAISSNLAKVGVATPNNNEIINAQNVGLTALALTSTNATPNTFLGGVALGGSTAGQNLTGFDNPAAAHVDGAAAGTAGLGGSPKAVLHANSGLGSTVTSGTLTITAPTNTLDGTYTGTITFTIIGS